MKRKTTAHKALLSSAISMLLCCAMLLGTTMAWFTATVESSGHEIYIGVLDIDLLNDTTSLKSNTTTKLFNDVKRWEPNATAIEELTVVNKGDLAFNYRLSLSCTDMVAGAAEQFEVWVAEGAKSPVDYDDIATDSNWKQVGTLAEVLAGNKSVFTGTMDLNEILPGNVKTEHEETYTIALHMKESATGRDANGNNVLMGKNFHVNVKLEAAQLTAENDGFGNNQYDKEAKPWYGTIPTAKPDTLELEVTGTQTGIVHVNTPEDLVYLNQLAAEWEDKYVDGYNVYYYDMKWSVELHADLNMNNIPMDTIGVSKWGAGFDGNGHTISNVVMKDGEIALFDKGEVENLNVSNITVNAPGAQSVGSVIGTNGAMNNVHVTNASVTGGKYVGGLAGKGPIFINCSVTNSTVTGTDKTVGGLVGYAIGDPNPQTVTGNVVENITVTGAYNVGGLLGQVQNETVDGNTVKNVTVTSTKLLPADASSSEVRAAEVAARQHGDKVIMGTNTAINVTIAEKPFTVYTAAELADALANAQNYTTIMIGADIDVSAIEWQPYVLDWWTHTLTIDGDGHKIIGLNTDTYSNGRSSYRANGFLADVWCDLVIKNLTFVNPDIDNAYVGDTGAAGVIIGNANFCNVTIDNCHIVGGSVDAYKYAGGFVGYTQGNGVETITIKNSTVTDTAFNTTDSSVSAFFGHTYNNLVFENCQVLGSTSVKCADDRSSSAAKAGFFVGTVNAATTTITNCTVAPTASVINVGTNVTVINDSFVGRNYGTLTVN